MDIISIIINLVFFIVVGAFTLLSILAIFIVIKYGKSPTVTVLFSLGYAGLFFLGFIGAFITLQQLI